MENGSNHRLSRFKNTFITSYFDLGIKAPDLVVAKLTINPDITFIFCFFDHKSEKIIHRVFNKKKFKNFELNKNYHNLVP